VNPSESTPAPAPVPRWQASLVGSPGIILAALWGVAEATFFFVVPDVFLSLVAILNWRRTWKHVISAIGGATLGGALLFQWAAADHQSARSAIACVPFIRERVLIKVHDGLQSQGLSALLWGSIEGIPYKLYAVEAPQFTRESIFLLATPPARAVRFLIVWTMFGFISGWLRSRFALRTAHLLRLYALIWIVVYACYWGGILSG
jgi:hypothetical protein